MSISEKIVELRIATRRACMCENTDKKKKNTLSLKTKILFLLKDKNLMPCDIISMLQIAKTNLAIMTSQMADEGLIHKIKSDFDKREITYEITDEGRAYLARRLDIIENAFKNILTDETEYESAVSKVDEVLSLLSFLGY